MKRLKALYVLDTEAHALVFGEQEQAAISSLVDVLAPPLTKATVFDHRDLLREMDILFSGWGAPLMNEPFLHAAPNLKTVFYAAGAISAWSTPEMFRRGVRVTTATHANSVPVSEYTLATILFSLKHGWRLNRETVQQRRFVGRDTAPGNFKSAVGLVSMGAIARLVVKLLKPFDLRVLAYDPYLNESEAELLGVRKVSLETLFAESDVVSIHAPELHETRGMITGNLIASMRPGATLINTARGGLIRQDEMIRVLQRRTDVHAVLDVTEPEPPPADCPLFDLPNVTLTPHIAGSAGNECRRMGGDMVQELKRYLNGEPLRWEVTQDMTTYSSHRSIAAPILPAFAERLAASV